MNQTNKKVTVYVKTLLLIVSTVATVSYIHSAEKRTQQPPIQSPIRLLQAPKSTLPKYPIPTAVTIVNRHNNDVLVTSENLPISVHVEYATKLYCGCGDAYYNSGITASVGKDFLSKNCAVAHDKSELSFYNHNFKEPKQTVPVNDRNVFNISKANDSDNVIVITRKRSFSDTNPQEVIRFTLKR